MLPLTRRLCCAPSPTSPRKRGEVAFHAVIASGAKQSMARHCQIEDGLLRSARNDGKILLRDLKHTSAISPQAREFCREICASETSEGAGNAGRSMRPRPRMQK